MNLDLSALNEEQLLPVMDTDGAVLVTAGAGSGKTRLLTYRIAHIVLNLGVPAYNILAITFTNKAAREMKERLEKMLPGGSDVFVSTFHAMCVRILRRYIDRLGYSKNFSIYDEDEKKRVIKAVAREITEDKTNAALMRKNAAKNGANFLNDPAKKSIKSIKNDDNTVEADALVGEIALALSRIKNEGEDAAWYGDVFKFLPHIDEIEEGVRRYETRMKACDALDFDDLLILTYRLLFSDGEAREYYRRRFKYIHVDEFQDTNVIQYKLLKLLSGVDLGQNNQGGAGNQYIEKYQDLDNNQFNSNGGNNIGITDHKDNKKPYGNILVVGDEDQSIYGWRGANIENIKHFIRDYSGARVYKLEQNYRSTKNILTLANAVIKNNTSRIEKSLWTENGDGIKPQLYVANRDSDEADFIMQTISGLRSNGHKLSSMAVLMRINALSRSIEQKLLFYGIPYRVYGGFKFYDRKEIKDITAYLKLLTNHRDDEAARRVISFPKRGIGDTSVAKMQTIAREKNLPLYGVIMSVEAQNPEAEAVRSQLGGALMAKLKILAGQLKLLEENKAFKISVLLKYMYKLLDIDAVFAGGSEEDESRRLNIRELINSVVQSEAQNPDLTLEDYVQQIMLLSDMDTDDGGDCVSIYTVHSAKGLEFDTVFLVGVEDGLFPLSRSIESDEVEEERRLMYVALTRAKKRLFISHTRSRFMYGKTNLSIPSRFLSEAGLLKQREGEQPHPSTFDRPSYNPAGNYANNAAKLSANSMGNGAKMGGAASVIASTAVGGALPQSGVCMSELAAGVRIKHKRLGGGVIKKVDNASRQVDVEFDTIGLLTLSVDFAPITIIK